MVIQEDNDIAKQALALLRTATLGTRFEGRLYLVGGALRDRVLGAQHGADLDLVIEGNAIELAGVLHNMGLSSHYPVLYPRFGTAMIHLVIGQSGVDVEMVTARSESYHPDSRKPDVQPGTLREDIFRRDFTINTLAENLHTGELLDITGRAFQDLEAGIVRTPVEPQITFFDDPLRMLRAIRLAARFQFRIEADTWSAIQAEAARLRPPTIALERIREEFIKIAMLPGKQFRVGVELLFESGLLAQFLPEMLPMNSISGQASGDENVWHQTLQTLEALPNGTSQAVRLALLWRDIGSEQPAAAADVTRTIMNRLKFANDEIHIVVELAWNQKRLVEYSPEWGDPAVKRLILAIYPILDPLFAFTECSIAGEETTEQPRPNLLALRARMDTLIGVVNIESPLDGNEIMNILKLGPGPYLKDAKEYLLNAVIDGILDRNNISAASEMLVKWWQGRDHAAKSDATTGHL